MTVDLVSVVIAARNAEDYVSASVESILRQTHREVEVIVVDDASTDGTREVVSNFRDSRVQLLSSDVNIGQAAALQQGINLSSGSWVARLDADDLSVPTRLQLQLGVARSLGSGFILGSSARIFGDRSGYALKRVTNNQLRAQMIFTSPLIHSSIFARRDTFIEIPYDHTFLFAQDYDWLERSSRIGVRLGNIPLPLVRYRVHSKMQSARPRIDGTSESMGKVFRRYLSDLELEFTDRELTIHFALAVRDPIELPPDTEIGEIREWAKRLIAQNHKKIVFPRYYFHQVVASRARSLIKAL